MQSPTELPAGIPQPISNPQDILIEATEENFSRVDAKELGTRREACRRSALDFPLRAFAIGGTSERSPVLSNKKPIKAAPAHFLVSLPANQAKRSASVTEPWRACDPATYPGLSQKQKQQQRSRGREPDVQDHSPGICATLASRWLAGKGRPSISPSLLSRELKRTDSASFLEIIVKHESCEQEESAILNSGEQGLPARGEPWKK